MESIMYEEFCNTGCLEASDKLLLGGVVVSSGITGQEIRVRDQLVYVPMSDMQDIHKRAYKKECDEKYKFVTDGGSIYKLKETMRTGKDGSANCVNDIYIRVDIQNVSLKSLNNPNGVSPGIIEEREAALAAHIAKLLNDNPLKFE